MKLTHRLLLLLLAVPCLIACNDSDDVSKIFLGKTWKLTNVFSGMKSPATDYWDSDEARKASIDKMSEESNYYVTFSGTVEDNDISGNYQGRALSSSISGSWAANGKNNAFHTSGQSTPNTEAEINKLSDPLEQVFIWAFLKAKRYDGDENDLRIYFDDPISGKERFLLFRAKK